MSTLHLHFEGGLPDDQIDQAEVMAKIKAPRDAFRAALTEAGFTHEHKTKIAKPRKATSTPRAARTPRAA